MQQLQYVQDETEQDRELRAFGKANPVIDSIFSAYLEGASKGTSYCVITDSEIFRDEIKGLGELEKEFGVAFNLMTTEEWRSHNDVAISQMHYSKLD